MKTKTNPRRLWLLGLGVVPFAAILAVFLLMPSPEVAANARPSPTVLLPMLDVPAVDGDYFDLAEKVGWVGANSVRNDIRRIGRRNEARQFFIDKGIGIYEEDRVSAYMDRLVKKKNWEDCPEGQRYESIEKCERDQYRWEWIGLDSGSDWVAFATMDAIGAPADSNTLWARGGGYTKPIPKNVLQTAALIKDRFPDARFEVTDVHERIDPFMRVWIAGEYYIFAAWDEPGF